MRRRNGIFIAYCDLLLVIVALLIVSVAPKKIEEGVKVYAEYQVSIEWNEHLDDDVDLWALGPTDREKPCFYKSTEVGPLFLDRDSRGFMDDRLKVDGEYKYLPHREVMTVRGIVPGRYDFSIHLYKARDTGAMRDPHNLGIVVNVEVQKINPRSRVIFRKSATLQYEGDAINVWSMDVKPDGGFIEQEPPVEPIS